MFPPSQVTSLLLHCIRRASSQPLTILKLAGYEAQRSASYPNPWLPPYEGEEPPGFGSQPAPVLGATNSWPPGPSEFAASNPRSTFGVPVAGTPLADQLNPHVDPLDTSGESDQLISVPLEQGGTVYNSLTSQLARRIPLHGGSPYNSRPGKWISFEEELRADILTGNVWRPRLHPSSTVSSYGEPVAIGSTRPQPMAYHIPTSFANQPSLHMWEHSYFLFLLSIRMRRFLFSRNIARITWILFSPLEAF